MPAAATTPNASDDTIAAIESRCVRVGLRMGSTCGLGDISTLLPVLTTINPTAELDHFAVQCSRKRTAPVVEVRTYLIPSEISVYFNAALSVDKRCGLRTEQVATPLFRSAPIAADGFIRLENLAPDFTIEDSAKGFPDLIVAWGRTVKGI